MKKKFSIGGEIESGYIRYYDKNDVAQLKEGNITDYTR